ncbi:MAG TPA: hypothetical protein VGQ30_06650 [Gemmatimonadaceae bacterium]|nr:hypothetical protein [Gemmatimonadaceae bacterium]
MSPKKKTSGRRSVPLDVELAAGAQSAADGVALYFNRGKELSDPSKLLKGSGKLVRSIELDGASTLARPEVVRLIEEAIERNRVPFARTGRGPMVVRSARGGR